MTLGDIGVLMTPLRQKLIDEIQLRGFSPNTEDSYVRSVAGLAGAVLRSDIDRKRRNEKQF